MAVPQGTDRAEWLDCYDRLLDMPEVDMIGLSKLSVPRSFGLPVAEARLACVEEVLKRPATKPIHLLGGDRSLPWELTEHRRRGNDCVVRSNDSSFAFWYAACGISVDPTTGRAEYEAPSKPDLINGVLSAGTVDEVLANIALLHRAAGVPSTTTSLAS
jgi:hypothetical protein